MRVVNYSFSDINSSQIGFGLRVWQFVVTPDGLLTGESSDTHVFCLIGYVTVWILHYKCGKTASPLMFSSRGNQPGEYPRTFNVFFNALIDEESI